MPTKTDRILSYLPSTFRALPPVTALYALLDPFGRELQSAENSLSEVMRAHWVDYADRGEDLIRDLACMAALYGLAPRGSDAAATGRAAAGQAPGASIPSAPILAPAGQQPGTGAAPGGGALCLPEPADETVEQFRAHLRRYIRTFIEGTVTVQGVMRVVAETLNLPIFDEYADIDTWWKRQWPAASARAAEDAVTVAVPRGEDAAPALFGVPWATSQGREAQPATLVGAIDLSKGLSLTGPAVLHLAVDGAAAVDVDVSGATDLAEVIEAVNGTAGGPLAAADGSKLALSSRTTGPGSRLEVQEGPNDAAAAVLGLLPTTFRGTDATPARLVGRADLSGAIAAGGAGPRYLRLAIDGSRRAEVDCAASSGGGQPTLAQVLEAINAALPNVASASDGKHLVLTSPTAGLASAVAVESPAGQDARLILMGDAPVYAAGRDAGPALVTGTEDLTNGINLSQASGIRVQIDGQPPKTIDCSGVDPANTVLSEIVAALNRNLGDGLASHDGRRVTLRGRRTGTSGSLVFLSLPPDQDAKAAIFGIRPRSAEGSAATSARIAGKVDLGEGANLWSVHTLRIAIDGRPAVEVDLRAGLAAPGLSAVKPGDLAAAINKAFPSAGAAIASAVGNTLALTSPSTGVGSRLALEPLQTMAIRRFGSAAYFADEAAYALFGHPYVSATGGEATPARVAGQVDLSRGVNVAQARYMRVTLDGEPPRDIDCAAGVKRPRIALPREIAGAINQAFGRPIASQDGKRLFLTSPVSGSQSRIAFGRPRAMDALPTLLGVEPGAYTGQDATGVSFVGTVDLGAGVDLTAGSRIKISVDAAGPAEIDCAGADAAHTSLSEVVTKINVALGDVFAHTSGNFLALVSPHRGKDSRITIGAPSSGDATAALLGVTPIPAAPREYHGTDALPAMVTGRPVSGTLDLSVSRWLCVGVDGGPALTIDAAKDIPDPAHASLDRIVQAINGQAQALASNEGGRLVLRSRSAGSAGRLALEAFEGGDALPVLFGDVPEETVGSDATPAMVTGPVLDGPVDLSAQHVLRLAIDGGHTLDVNVAGANPATTFVDEVAAAVNAALPHAGGELFPDVAAVTPEGALQISSPTAGAASRLDIRPVRALRVIEYPPEPRAEPPRTVQHGDRWTLVNDGAADGVVGIEIATERGAAGPQIYNLTADRRIHFMSVLSAGERVRLEPDPRLGVRGTITDAQGRELAVSPDELLIGPAGHEAIVPFSGEWRVTRGTPADPGHLHLNNPISPRVLTLRAFPTERPGAATRVAVVAAALPADGGQPLPAPAGQELRLAGRVQSVDAGWQLAGADGKALVALAAGPGVTLEDHRDRVAAVSGRLYAGQGGTPLLLAGEVDALFDVMLSGRAAALGQTAEGYEAGQRVTERYAGVTIGGRPDSPWDLAWQINARGPDGVPGNAAPNAAAQAAAGGGGGDLPGHSLLVVAVPVDKAEALALPTGTSDWLYTQCIAPRFDHTGLGHVRFPLACRGARHHEHGEGRRHEQGDEWHREHAEEPDRDYDAEHHYGHDEESDRDYDAEHHYGHHEERPHDHDAERRHSHDEERRHHYGEGRRRDYDDEGRHGHGEGPHHGHDEERHYHYGEGRGRDHEATRQGLGEEWPQDYDEEHRHEHGEGRHHHHDDVPLDACCEWAVFDISRLGELHGRDRELAALAPEPRDPTPAVITMQWTYHRPGAFTVNLPADLPEQYGGRFDEARFGFDADKSESFNAVVTEPQTDPDWLVKRLEESQLVQACVTDVVPLGFVAYDIPLRNPRQRKLSGGRAGQRAQVYLRDPDLGGMLFALFARQPGAWGNGIGVTVRRAGPAVFDVTVNYEGARFESATHIALAGRILGPGENPFPPLTQQGIGPGPVGVLQARAAGIHSTVTRERAGDTGL